LKWLEVVEEVIPNGPSFSQEGPMAIVKLWLE